MTISKKIEKIHKKLDCKWQIHSNKKDIEMLAKMYVDCKHSGLASERAKCKEIAMAINGLRLKNKLREIQYDLI